MMRPNWQSRSIVGLLFGLLLVGALLSGSTFVGPSLAQTEVLPSATDAQNETSGVGLQTLMQVQVETVSTFSRMAERSSATYTVIVRDASVEGSQAYAAGVSVSCEAINQTANANGWGYSTTPIPYVPHGGEVRADFRIFSATRPSPEFFYVDFSCRAGAPINDVVGNFTLGAQVEEFVYMGFSTVNTLSTVRPDQNVDFVVKVTNSGSHVKRFFGEVKAPPGWTVPTPPALVLLPGESSEVTITGIAPRDQLFYLSSSETVLVTYYPDGDPGKGRTVFFPVTLKGLYLHPALIPLTLLTVLLVSVLVFFVVLARRAVEEQILGKPVPPWRIPVEREFLRTLMRENQDEYYIVRHYLMVEEHRSALLWFEAFKKATKKDRKRESTWFKMNRKQERKVIRVKKDHQKLSLSWEKKIAKPEKVAVRAKAKLERKLRRKERKQQRKINRKHRKLGRTLEKKHNKRVKKELAKFEKRRAREIKKAERANKKREKRGEEPLPLPDPQAPSFEDPVLPPAEQVVEMELTESRYAKRAVRVDAKAVRARQRLMQRRDGALEKDSRRVEAKSAKFRSKIPPEPATALYDKDQYVPEDEIVVEDDRSPLARWLALPTLEERDAERRRKRVHQASVIQAKQAGQVAQANQMQAEFKAARKARSLARRDEVRAAAAQRQEDARLAAARKRDVRERAKQIKAEAEPAVPRADETAPHPVHEGIPSGASPAGDESPARRRFKVGKRKPVPAAAEQVSAESESEPVQSERTE